MKRHPLAAIGLGLLVLVAAGAIASAATGDGQIHACKIKRHGFLRMLDAGASCKRSETAVSWNIQGVAGPAGPAGAPGPQGPKGDPGGVASVAALSGTPCTTFDGAAGTVSIDTTATDLITLSCDSGTPPPPPPGGSSLVINEVDYDQVGTDSDTAGFVEIKNVGDTTATLDGVALVFVNGGDSTEYARVALTGTLAAGAYTVVAKDAQNGAPDGFALIDTTTGNLLDALSYEGSITAAVIDGKTYSLVEGTVLPDTVVDSNTINGSLIRNPDGKDTDNAASDWAFTSTPTRGVANVLTP
ncbi:MAG: lamin tail domain-containing protein [Gaiellaceae bacterium]